MEDHIFRMYDVRGVVGVDLSIDHVYDFARAFAYYCIEKNPSVKTVVVGMDGRVHSELLKEQIVRGLVDSGLDVIFVGMCTTPLVYFSQYWLQVQAGIMITASHNPKEYNGFKLILNKTPVAGEKLQVVKQYFLEKKYLQEGTLRGTVVTYDLLSAYTSFLMRLFPHLKGCSLPLVVDCANAVSAKVVRPLFEKFGFKNYAIIHETIDGTFVHHPPDPSVAENMRELRKHVIMKKYALGVGFDGDADRMGIVTPQRLAVPGDHLLTLFAHSVLEQHQGASVVFDTKCSSMVHETIIKMKGIPQPSKTGHTFIRQAIQESGALVGGELSCHFFFHDRYFGFDDGIYAALRLLEILVARRCTIDTLLDELPQKYTSPELRIPSPLHGGEEIVKQVQDYFATQKDTQLDKNNGIRVVKKYGWGLLRSSNTQSVISLRMEADTQENLLKVRNEFISALKNSYSIEFLEKHITW